MSFLVGDISAGGRFIAPDLQIPTWLAPLSAHAGRTVELGIRPEHVQVAPGEADAIEAPVEVIEPMGSDLLVWTRLAGAPVSVRLPAETRVAVGDHLPLRFPPERISLFDPATGERLS